MRSRPSGLPGGSQSRWPRMVRLDRAPVDAQVGHPSAEVEEQRAVRLDAVELDDRPAPVRLAPCGEIDRERVGDPSDQTGPFDGLVTTKDVSIGAAG